MDPKGQEVTDAKVNSSSSAALPRGDEGQGDVADAKGLSWFGGRRSSEPIIPTSKNAEDYYMSHASRGIAVIFNHQTFNPRLNLNERRGSGSDRDNLQNLVKHLGFTKENIYVFENLDSAAITKQLEKISEMDHTNHDCLFVAISTHGDQGILYAHDKKYPSDSLWSVFAGNRCPSLAGKPKLFFIQACQGDRVDSGVTMEDRTDGMTRHYKIPAFADFLLVYSTIPGFYSWRNTEAGSWFIQALCNVLSSKSHDSDLLSLLTVVNRHVAYDYISNVPYSTTMDQKKQIPCVTSMLTRKVFFRPKSSGATAGTEKMETT